MGNPLQYLPINEALYRILYGIQLPIHPPRYVPIYHAQEPTPRCLHPIVQNHWHNTKTHRVLTNVFLSIQFLQLLD
jgi:hypothetical protein